MNWKFIKWYQVILFTLFLTCAPDRDEFISYNVMKFYTRALQNSDYTIIIKKDGKIKYNVKYNVQ